MTEEWRPIETWEGCYLVSNLGRVKSCKKNKIMAQYIDQYGYCKVQFSAYGREETKRVHRLVAAAFHDKGIYNMVLHRNGKKTDNGVDNLYWGDTRQNILDAKRHGTIPKNGWCMIVTDEQVLEIRARHAQGGVTYKELAEEYGVGYSAIQKIVLRQRRNLV